jgi:hypothetical protein
MSGSPLSDVVVAMQLGPTEEVGEHVIYAGPVLRSNREVVA